MIAKLLSPEFHNTFAFVHSKDFFSKHYDEMPKIPRLSAAGCFLSYHSFDYQWLSVRVKAHLKNFLVPLSEDFYKVAMRMVRAKLASSFLKLGN